MRWRPITWLLLSVACFLGAFYFWRLGEQWHVEKTVQPPAAAPGGSQSSAGPAAPQAVKLAPLGVQSASTMPVPPLLSQPPDTNAANLPKPGSPEARLKYRLSNTTQTVGELSRNENAIMLANALIDSSKPLSFAIPDEFRSKGDPGSYLVQARGLIDDAFRSQLKAAGVTVVTYFPNNAYLVTASASVAGSLKSQSRVKAVLPYEPIYKVPLLLDAAMEGRPAPNELKVLLFADAAGATVNEMKRMGMEVSGEERAPHGTIVWVKSAPSLAAVAGLPGVQIIEPARPRVLANDLSRVAVGVSTDPTNPASYLDLSGTNVIVAVNDSWVATNGLAPFNPDLPLNKFVSPLPFFTDRVGHATHVAGIIASSGANSPTNAIGSVPGANFRGHAPGAQILAMPIQSFYSDANLQEAAAGTNALISNNSWGYGNSDYDLSAASYDQAVRDALPMVTGSQPVLFVFAAGNSGGGNDDGVEGNPNSVSSPATAKNVVTVGTVEQARNITNSTFSCNSCNPGSDCVTNQPWLGFTDSSNQVARFSSRGNVGVNIEGEFGRFKPDVVAPGTMMVSTRSMEWDTAAYYNPTNYHVFGAFNLVAQTNELYYDTVFIPCNAVQWNLSVDAFAPNVDLPVYVKQSDFPDTVTYDVLRTNVVSIPPDLATLDPRDVDWFFGIGNPTTVPVRFNLFSEIVTVNDTGNFFDELRTNLNDRLVSADGNLYYRYESGSSMSAPAVSGTLALMREFFQERTSLTDPSPALLKAMLINGARSLGDPYDFQVLPGINYQGWGKINLPNSLPGALSNLVATTAPMYIFEQDSTNALATGQSRTYKFKVSTAGSAQPLRVTLAWTDPPGNPAAGIKLVNDLDLVVTNDGTGLVYFGNDIRADQDFNLAWDTNTAPAIDNVNNVENVYINAPTGTNYTVIVTAHRVNVNAVTAHTNNMVQDYVLVVSSGDSGVTNALELQPVSPVASLDQPNVTAIANSFTNTPGLSGGLLLNQRVGASSPLLGTRTRPLANQNNWGTNGVITLGQTNQWHFYVITNSSLPDFTNAAFVTFLPPNLGVSPGGVNSDGNAARVEADIDLYVSTNPNLTNLGPVAITTARKSLTRGGTEVIVLSDAVPGGVYYVGVKSEDQEAAEYGFLGLFSDEPFGQRGPNGEVILRGVPVPAPIPDGTPAKPGAALVFGIGAEPIAVRRVVVTNTMTHTLMGDLLGNLSHNQKFAVLNNHSCVPGSGGVQCLTNVTFVYEDNGENDIPGSRPTDAPGSLKNFIGEEGSGLWLLTQIDNAETHVGQVENVQIRLDPQVDTNGIVLNVQPNSFAFNFIDVPENATNLTVCIANLSATPGPVELYLRFGDLPTQTVFDHKMTIIPPGGCLSVGLSDLPPLRPGRYFVGVFNPNATVQTVRLTWTFELNPFGVEPVKFSAGPGSLFDDALTNSSIVLTNNENIVSINVGVVIDHPRVSDLALTLISPTGQRIVLFENRGGANATNLGHLQITTNFFPTTVAGGPNADTNMFPVQPAGGKLIVDYDFFTVPDTMDVYYDNANIFSSGSISNLAGPQTFIIPYGPGTSSNIFIVMNQGGNSDTNTMWTFTARVITEDFTYLTFTDNTNLTRIPIKYALPPYDLLEDGTNYVLSDFENATNREYLAITSIFDPHGGWSMTTNPVGLGGTNFLSMATNQASVITDPGTAHDGTNYLALANGSISRVVPTTPGRKYTVSYWHRGPGISGWWRGEGNPTDSSDPESLGNHGSLIGTFTFPQGKVGQAFQLEDAGAAYQFAGTNTYVQVRQSDSLDVGRSSGLTVEGWINPTNLQTQQPLVEWLALVPTNGIPTNIVIEAGPFLNRDTGHYYYLLGSTNWTTSESWANQLGGHLVTINTANEQNWVYDAFSQFGDTNRMLWIGFNNASGPFAWSSGETNAFYTHWAPGQPNNCSGVDHYAAILSPTNALAGLWTLEDNEGLTCGAAPTNLIYGVVEVNELQTNGLQLWISVTNSVISSNGGLYADLVDISNVSHVVYSPPGIVQSNVYQHVALTYDTNTGVASFYYNGTNLITTNLGVFVPKTGGDVLLGKDMTRVTNNFYSGKLDEMSVYRRFLSPSEIAAIYNRGPAGKFDPSVTPAQSLAETHVAFGTVTNIIFSANTNWLMHGFTFRAESDSLPIQITGLTPGALLDSFGVAEAPPGNLYVLPEEALKALVGESAFGQWTLEIRDARTGAVTGTGLLSWQLQFVLQSNTPVAIPLSPQNVASNTVPPGQIAYFTVDVPSWATFATNILVSSTAPVDLLFNQTTRPTGFQPGDFTFVANNTAGSYTMSTNPVPPPPLLPGQRYYLGVRNSGGSPATVAVRVDFDLITLTNGVPFVGAFNTNDLVRYFVFDVSSNAYAATFQLLNILSNNVDLVVRKGLPLPTLFSSDYGSFSQSDEEENIYVLTNSLPVNLSPGRWYLGVFKRNIGPAAYTILAKELVSPAQPTIIDLTNNVPCQFTAGPGAALTNFFRFTITNFARGVRFEVYNLSGNGDLTVQTNALPLAPPFWQSSQMPGLDAELVLIHTNANLTNLNTAWYLGVPNRDTNPITFTIVASLITNECFAAFPGAEGAGACAEGGRGGSVYHVVNLNDSGPGSLRDAVSAPLRTVVFDISGTIDLLSPLVITSSNLTIAGQSAPGDGIALRGWGAVVQDTHDVIIRYLRFRPGDINCPANQGDSLQFTNVSDVIVDHVSATWSVNDAVSAFNATNLTVQWSIVAESLSNSCNASGPHGFGSELRYGSGILSFHHNLYVHNDSANPLMGDNLNLDFVNNVLYNWGAVSGASGTNDLVANPGGYTNILNYACNYLIAGSNSVWTNVAFWSGTTNTWIFQTNNIIDSHVDGLLNGANTGSGMLSNLFTEFNRPFPLPVVSTDEGFIAYERVLDFAGAALDKRDTTDARIVRHVRRQIGAIIDSQTQVGGWPVLNSTALPPDADSDGIPDSWEVTLGEPPTNASSNLDRDGDGYTDLEEYLNWLGVPHALTVTNTAVNVDLFRLSGNTGILRFEVANATNGTVVLTNNIATFTPFTNLSGYASFDYYVTNQATFAHFGPVTVSVMVEGQFAPTIIPLTNGVPLDFSTGPGSVLTNFFSFDITQSNSAVLFELYNLSGDGDLLVQRTNLPTAPPYFASSSNAGTAYEQIVIRTNGALPDINAISWFLAVPNNDPALITYTIRAILSTNGILISSRPIDVTVTAPGGTNVQLTFTAVDGEHYEILAATNLALPMSNWTVIGLVTAVGPTGIFVDPTPISASPFLFYRVNQVP